MSKPALPMIFGSGPMADAVREQMAKDPDRYRPVTIGMHQVGVCPWCMGRVVSYSGRENNFEDGFAAFLGQGEVRIHHAPDGVPLSCGGDGQPLLKRRPKR